MPFIVETERLYESPPEAVFDRLADAGRWREWMPRSFRPLHTPRSPLRVGDRLRVLVAGAPTRIEVVVAERARELAWSGGHPRLLSARHHFFFEAEPGGKTVVRSVETWSGPLAPLVRPVVQRLAARVGRAQLDGLARALT